MKKLIVIETVQELFDFANKHRMKGDDKPVLPSEATIVFSNNFENADLQKADGFILSDKITSEQIVTESLKRSELNIHIT